MEYGKAQGTLGLLFAASGLTALVYQLVWARWAGLVLGHFAPAAAVVVATWMAGMAIGYRAFGPPCSRLSPARALKLYAILEGAVAVFAAASPAVFHWAGAVYASVAGTGPGWLVRAAWCAILLLPPTVLMGGTLPAVVQAARASGPGPLGRLYALNTAGAAAGPVLAAFVLMPVLGIRNTLWLACVLNAAVAAAAWRLAARWEDSGEEQSAASPAGPDPAVRLPLVLAACAGFLALGFEIALTRLVTLTVTLTSVYGFAVVLSGFLLGLAAGAWMVRRRPPGAAGGLAAFAVALVVAWGWAFAASFWDLLPRVLVGAWQGFEGFAPRIVFDAVVTFVVLLPLPAAFGYALPALAGPGAGARGIGNLFAANTAGAIAGALVAGFVALPILGIAGTIRGLGALSLLLAGAVAWAVRPGMRPWLPFALAGMLVLGVVVPEPDPMVMNAGLALRPRLAVIDDARAGRLAVIHQADGLSGRVSVIADPEGGMVFSIDGAPNASTSPEDLLTQAALAYLPAVMVRAPRRALVIGMGTGMTAGSLSIFPGVEEVRVAEIEPAQAGVAAVFHGFNHDVMNRPNVRITYDDARHVLLAGRESYDVISSDPADLFVSGMANLYTREFYRLVRSRLAPGGAFVQWIHAYHLDSRELRGVLGTALEAFPNAGLWVEPHGDLFLLATDGPLTVDLEVWDRRLRDPGVSADLARGGVAPASDLAGLLIWGSGDLARYTLGARPCTDADPFPEFTAPRRPFSREAQNRLGREVALYAPLDPAPLARESASSRLRLARLALGHGFLARARTECLRGLALARGRRDLAELLGRINEAERTGVVPRR